MKPYSIQPLFLPSPTIFYPIPFTITIYHAPFFFFFLLLFSTSMITSQENTSIQQATSLLSSALSSSSSSSCLRRLPVKWHSIRSKLQRLHSSLTSATNNGDSAQITKLIQSISVTAEETELLSRRCLDESYGGGTLLMKSDLDVVAGKLDLCIKHLDEMCVSGALRSSSKAMVLAKPGTGASREEMRFYVKDLFCRLRIGDLEMRATTLSAINEIIREDDKYVRIVAVETVDSSNILVNLLEFRDIRLQKQSLEVVVVVSSFESYRNMLSIAGVIPPLLRILRQGTGIPAKERAAEALKQMTENCNNSWLVSSQGGVPTLLKICREENPNSSKLINLACASLRNISFVGEIKRFMVEEGAIPVFLNLLKSKEEVLQIEAMDFLLMLTSDTEDEDIQIRVLESLLSIMNPNSLCSSKVRELNLRSIERFCFTSTNNVKYLLNSGFPDRIIFLLKHGEILDKESALKSAFRFCGVSDEVKKVMGDMGLMTELLRMLEDGSFEVRETAAETLCSLMAVQRNRRRFIREEEEGVDRVLQELNPEEGKSGLNNVLLSVLISLTDSNDGRRRVANSNHVRNLEKLAQINSVEAKKIMKRITTGNKFRSIFNGIWGR